MSSSGKNFGGHLLPIGKTIPPFGPKGSTYLEVGKT